jgi:hypothetical protein
VKVKFDHATINDGPDQAHGYAIVTSNKSYHGVGHHQGYPQGIGLRSKVKGDFLWFRDGDKTYLIQDPALMAKVDAAGRPSTASASRWTRRARRWRPGQNHERHRRGNEHRRECIQPPGRA